MQGCPLVGITEQLPLALEVAATEGLQGVLGGQAMQQVAATGQRPGAGKMVAQLTNQHGRRSLAVVANAAPYPADIQTIARRQQRFQQQIAVILAARAVTGAVIACHQVEIQRRLAARIVPIVHAQQADLTERNRAHRHQGAEVHRASEKTLAQPPLVEPVQPGLAHHR